MSLQMQAPGQPLPPRRVKVLRPFMYRGERVTVDSVVQLDGGTALEVINSQKAEETDDRPRIAPDRPNPAPAEPPKEPAK